MQEYILDGVPHGPLAAQAQQFDLRMTNRPFLDERGIKCVTVRVGNKLNPKTHRLESVYKKRTVREMQAAGVDLPIANLSSLRKDEWILIDDVVSGAVRRRLRAWIDLDSRNPYGGFDGFSSLMLESERSTDSGSAQVDMSGLTEGQNNDQPLFQPEGVPLAITHSDFWFEKRHLAISRKQGTRLDLAQAANAGHKVAEQIERMLIGLTTSSVTIPDATSVYGNPLRIYGYMNHPDTITKTDLTTPTANNSVAVLQDVIEMRQLAYNQNFRGPFILYTSPAYDQWLDMDYGITAGTPGANAAWGFAPSQTLRKRIEAIRNIEAVHTLDLLSTTDYIMLLVQMTPEVAQAVTGMPITTLRWEEVGGMRLMFKVMGIMVPRIRSQFVGTSTTTSATGIVYATTT